MAYIKEIEVNGTVYDIEDVEARESIDDLYGITEDINTTLEDYHKITVSDLDPSSSTGNDGDIWLKIGE
jgi:hypothetical protein